MKFLDGFSFQKIVFWKCFFLPKTSRKLSPKHPKNYQKLDPKPSKIYQKPPENLPKTSQKTRLFLVVSWFSFFCWFSWPGLGRGARFAVYHDPPDARGMVAVQNFQELSGRICKSTPSAPRVKTTASKLHPSCSLRNHWFKKMRAQNRLESLKIPWKSFRKLIILKKSRVLWSRPWGFLSCSLGVKNWNKLI